MDFSMILPAVLIVSGIGLIIGLVLAIASAVMAVPTDEVVEAITEALPGANCGACGYSGCAGYAKALKEGKAKLGVCSPGGDEAVMAISEILGVEATSVCRTVALVHCMGSCDNTDTRMDYQGISSCAAAAALHGGNSSCSFGCLGLGDCEKVCPYGAITVCNGVARVDSSLCKGCSLCIASCPKHIISLTTDVRQGVVRCSNTDKGAQARKVCKVACIGCKRCEKVCEAGAITVTNFKAVVDGAKCNGCGACVEACTQGCVTMYLPVTEK
ncbi:MAG: RnfABCDGE type electron transport complex subunit B [Ruminococcus sp.]|nr:RnfABCDGE type electron transport complex subunit B [Ruminococcus sp.]